MKVIIAGGRKFDNYELLREKCDNILGRLHSKDIEIVSGSAEGADSLGEKYAAEFGYNKIIFKADWDKFGKAAGPIRNVEMANYADALIIFWDGLSKGSLNMIKEAKKRDLSIRVINY